MGLLLLLRFASKRKMSSFREVKDFDAYLWLSLDPDYRKSQIT